ncbi:hypothetical protein DM02DRAFT_263231 [Periconia macrospinosa]|uniref:Uncharacterized protein n=1 Tax=Periconia macrospinosa TaxID=97972 RepID=A0A2V1D464_9PLEO|nr:hypothetical protein DM02DRAFT_263231 [Periconia macrospinosa]
MDCNERSCDDQQRDAVGCHGTLYVFTIEGASSICYPIMLHSVLVFLGIRKKPNFDVPIGWSTRIVLLFLIICVIIRIIYAFCAHCCCCFPWPCLAPGATSGVGRCFP